MAVRIIDDFTTRLTNAFSICVHTVSDHCLAKELITEEVYKEVLESSGSTDTDKARILLSAIKDAVATNNSCFEEFLNILNLPEVFPELAAPADETRDRAKVKPQLVLDIEEKYGILKELHVRINLAKKERLTRSLSVDDCHRESRATPRTTQTRDEAENSTENSPQSPSYDETSYLEEIRIIRVFTPKLVSAISSCVMSVSDECLAKGLLTDAAHKRLLESVHTDSEDKVRFLLQAIKSSIKTDKRCFKIFIDDVLKEKLPRACRDKLISEIEDELQKRAKTGDDSTPELPYDIKSAVSKVQELTEQCAQVNHEKTILEEKLASKIEENQELKAKLSTLETEGQHEKLKQLKDRIKECETEINVLKGTVNEKEAVIQEYRMNIKREETVAYRVVMDTQKEAKDSEVKARMELEGLKLENSNLRQEIDRLKQQDRPHHHHHECDSWWCYFFHNHHHHCHHCHRCSNCRDHDRHM